MGYIMENIEAVTRLPLQVFELGEIAGVLEQEGGNMSKPIRMSVSLGYVQ